MDMEHIRREAEKWARIIAEAYAEKAEPAMPPELQARLADRVARRLRAAMVTGRSSADWGEYLNSTFDAWERELIGRGPRLVSVDEIAGTVRMEAP
jgi:hypothetical protein